MKISQVAKLRPFDRLVYFIKERENIRLQKEAGKPKPWTDDDILLSYRFCNVRRMDDLVSRWLLDNWYNPNFDHRNMPVACALARFVNWPDSLKEIGFPKVWNPDRIRTKLQERWRRGEQILSGAYMVRADGEADKPTCIVDHYCQPLVDYPLTVNRDSMEETWANLLEYYGFGSFIAGQVVADLRWAMRGTWADRLTWAPIGPGSRRGMNRLHERDLSYPLKQDEFLRELRQLMKDLKKRLPDSITSRLEAHDYQNCLCEWDKHERCLWGEGRPKVNYPGRR